MFKELFTQLYQTIEELDEEFVLANNIDEELLLLEKYLTFKEMSTDLNKEVNKLNVRINNFERVHGLIDLNIEDYNSLSSFDSDKNTAENEEIVIQLEEQDFLTFQSGIGFYDLLMYDRAKINLEEIVIKYPDFNLARLYSSMTYLKQKQFTKAKKEVHMLLKLSDDNALLSLGHNILGMVYGYENNYDLSIEHFRQAIILKTNWNESKFNLAIVFLKNKMVNEAIELLEELYQQKRDDWEILILLGRAYQTIHQFELAKEFYRQAYLISKKPIAIKQLIRYFEHNNDFEKAVYWYKKWLEYEPKSIIVIIGLAKSFWLINKQKEAQATIKKALTIEPDNIEALLLFAWFQTDNNRANALKTMEQVAKIRNTLDISDSLIAANLARLYYLNKDYSTSNNLCEILLSSTQDTLIGLGHIVKGLNYLDQHEPKKALTHLKEPMATSLNFPNLNFYIGYSYYLLGDSQQAKNYWNNILI